jgi:lipopolysaccharide export system permease protein
MSRVAFRYIARSVAYYTLLTLAAFVTLFMFFNVLDELDKVGRGNYSFLLMLLYVLLQAPGNIAELAPVAALIGGVVALAALAGSSEITVLRAAGLSTGRLAFWIVLMSVPYSMGMLVFADYVAPMADQKGTRIRLAALQLNVAQELASGSWVKDSTGLAPGASRYVNVAKLLPDGSLSGVRMYEVDTANRLVRVVKAASARSVPGGWQFQDVSHTEFIATDGPLGETSRANASQLPTWQWKTDVSARVFGAISRQPEQMGLLELTRTIEFLAANQQQTAKLELVLYKKLLVPLSIAVMLLLALPFAFLHTRSGGVSVKVFAGILLGILFFTLNSLFSHLGVLNTWPALATALAPSVFGLVVAVGMLMWVQRAR